MIKLTLKEEWIIDEKQIKNNFGRLEICRQNFHGHHKGIDVDILKADHIE